MDEYVDFFFFLSFALICEIIISISILATCHVPVETARSITASKMSWINT